MSRSHVARLTQVTSLSSPAARRSRSMAIWRNLPRHALLAHAHWLPLALAAPFLILDPARGWLGVALLCVAHLVRLLHPDVRRRHLDLDANWPTLSLIVFGVIGALVSPAPQASLPKLFGILFAASLYAALVSSLRSSQPPATLRIAVTLYLALGVALAIGSFLLMQPRRSDAAWIHALYQARPPLAIELRSSHGVALVQGVHPNEVAGALVLFLPLFLALLLRRPTMRSRAAALAAIAAGIGTLLVSLVLVATLSRTGLIAIIVGLVTLALLKLLRAVRLVLCALALVSMIVAAGYLALLSAQGQVDLWGQAERHLGPALELTRDDGRLGTLRWRLDLWREALGLALQYPWTGIGLNAFPLYVRDPGALAEAARDVPHAHNLFLQTALDLGIPGLASLVALLSLALARTVSAIRHPQDELARAIAGGVLASLLAHLAFSAGDAVALGAKPGVALWALLALGITLPAARQSNPLPRPAGITSLRPSLKKLASAVCAAALLVAAYRPLAASILTNLAMLDLSRVRIAGEIEASVRAEERFRAALAYAPGDRSVLRGLGFALLAQGREREALDAWRSAGNIGRELLAQGEKARSANRIDEAIAWYDRALAVEREAVESAARFYRSLALRAQRDTAAADAALQVAVAVDSGWESAETRYRAWHVWGVRLHELRQHAAAERALWRAAVLYPGGSSLAWHLSETYRYLGLAQAAQGRKADALRSYGEAVRLNPKSPWAQVSYGATLHDIDPSRVREAEEAFAAALRLRPNDVGIWRSVIAFWRGKGDVARASALCDEAAGAGLAPKMERECGL